MIPERKQTSPHLLNGRKAEIKIKVYKSYSVKRPENQAWARKKWKVCN